MKKLLFTIVIGLASISLFGQIKRTLPEIKLTVKDITPKFLSFYDMAIKTKGSDEKRWELWKSMYGFSATPPTPMGDTLARQLLDNAWSLYPSRLSLIKEGAPAIVPHAEKALHEIAGLLIPDSLINIRLLVYVGGFEDNAFTMAANGTITAAVAIEITPAKLPLIITHELTHAVQIGMGNISGDWVRTIGTALVAEGLAMRVSQKIFPGHPDKDFIEHKPGWLKEIETHEAEILRNIRPFLSSSSLDDVMRFTMGVGASGFEREAYYAGWLVVGYWLNHGMNFSDIARISEKDMP